MSENPEPKSAVAIISITPDIGTVLKRGEKVKLEVEVKYQLTEPRAQLVLTVQKDTVRDKAGELIAPLLNKVLVVTQGEGVEKFEEELVVPEDTQSVSIFVPLCIMGSDDTEIVDVRSYKVQ